MSTKSSIHHLIITSSECRVTYVCSSPAWLPDDAGPFPLVVQYPCPSAAPILVARLAQRGKHKQRGCWHPQALYSHASSPLKMVGMMGFMMWMSGSQLHIFSIMTTLSGVYQPLSAILSSGSGGRALCDMAGPPSALSRSACSSGVVSIRCGWQAA